MNCKKVWNDDFIDTSFPKSFIKKELKAHLEEIMFERQEAMFSETINLNNQKKKMEKIQSKINKLKKKIQDYQAEMEFLKNAEFFKHDSTKKKVNIIKKCPKNKCQGYLDDNYKCSTCDTILCIKCECILKENHKCKPEDVETVKIKKQTSKPCPTCSKLTFKDGGCAQVWCPPPCNGGKGTAWNFNTGEIEKGPVHSPDYYDYMRKNNNGVVPTQNCNVRNDMPDIWEIRRYLKPLDDMELTERHRFFVDLKNNIMNKYIETNNDEFTRNLDLRVKYLSNSIDKVQFKRTLFARNKKINKNKTIYENLNMLYNVGVDIFNDLKYNHRINRKIGGLIDTSKIYEEMENIRKYYNNIIKKTKSRYDCKSLKVSKLTKDWTFSY